MSKAIQLWIVTDAKPGHINQSLGLAEALKRQVPNLNWQEIPAMSMWQAIRFALKQNKNTLKPDLIIGAGHRTHLTLLLLSKIMTVASIVLMKPSLPNSWFDLVIIPEHDSPGDHTNIIASKGALNRVQAGRKESNTGLFLIGGPSKHFGWDPQALSATVQSIVQESPLDWELTTSRRTPEGTLTKLQPIENIEINPYSKTDSNWLPTMLSKTEVCWVTEDSVSMIYEALSAGCQVGLIKIPHVKESRLTIGIEKLEQSGYLMRSTGDKTNKITLAEADRCAALVQQRFLT